MTIEMNITEFCDRLSKQNGDLMALKAEMDNVVKFPSAMERLEMAFNKKRKEMYGDNWQNVDWWGLPVRKPEENKL